MSLSIEIGFLIGLLFECKIRKADLRIEFSFCIDTGCPPAWLISARIFIFKIEIDS